MALELMETPAGRAAENGRRVLLVSLQDLRPQVWNGVSYEFIDVVAGMENATVVAPGRRWTGSGGGRPVRQDLAALADHAWAAARSVAGLSTPRLARRTEVEGVFDLCFYMCQFPREIGEINSVRGWRERSGIACAFVLETWPSEVDGLRADYRLLDAFDHAFVFNPLSVEAVQRHTSTPVSFLATGADTLMLPKSRYAVERCIDYLCIGRRRARFHSALAEYCEARDRFYLFDVLKDMQVRDWAAARRHNAELGARTRHFVVWAPERAAGAGRPPELALTTRYFEGASAGAVMLGSRPRLPEFDRLFDWPDPVIELPEDPAELAGFLDALDSDRERLAAIGERNRLQALARHDWAYRWGEVLAAAGLEEGEGLRARLGELGRRRLAETLAHRGLAAAPERVPAGRIRPAARG